MVEQFYRTNIYEVRQDLNPRIHSHLVKGPSASLSDSMVSLRMLHSALTCSKLVAPPNNNQYQWAFLLVSWWKPPAAPLMDVFMSLLLLKHSVSVISWCFKLCSVIPCVCYCPGLGLPPNCQLTKDTALLVNAYLRYGMGQKIEGSNPAAG